MRVCYAASCKADYGVNLAYHLFEWWSICRSVESRLSFLSFQAIVPRLVKPTFSIQYLTGVPRRSRTMGSASVKPVRSRFHYLFTKFVIEWWLLELASWIFSAMSVITIIGVLWYYDGKALPQWGLGITLNSFISIFSNLARAALILPTAEALGQLKWNWFNGESKTMMDFEIFDSASRGPWGAFLLLLRTRGRYVGDLLLGKTTHEWQDIGIFWSYRNHPCLAFGIVFPANNSLSNSLDIG